MFSILQVTRRKTPDSCFQPLSQPVMLAFIYCPSDGRQDIQDTCEVLLQDFSFHNDNIKTKSKPTNQNKHLFPLLLPPPQKIKRNPTKNHPQKNPKAYSNFKVRLDRTSVNFPVLLKTNLLWRDGFLAKPNTFNCGSLIYSCCFS